MSDQTSANLHDINVVVNAGGIIEGAEMGSVTNIGKVSYDNNMDLNLKSVYLTVQKAFSYMNDGASIILIGSTAVHRASVGTSVYNHSWVYRAKRLAVSGKSIPIKVLK